MRSSNREDSTQVVRLTSKKSVFYLSAPDPEKGDDTLEPQLLQQPSTEEEHQSTHTHHDSSLLTIKKTKQPSQSDKILNVS